MPFVLRFPCLSVCPPLLLLLLMPMFYQVSIPHPLHCHHGDTWPVTSLCCSSVLVSFFSSSFFFNLTLSLCFVWLIMSGSSNSVSISNVVLIYIYFISLMFHSVFVFLVVFGLFIFLQVNFLLI